MRRTEVEDKPLETGEQFLGSASVLLIIGLDGKMPAVSDLNSEEHITI